MNLSNLRDEYFLNNPDKVLTNYGQIKDSTDHMNESAQSSDRILSGPRNMPNDKSYRINKVVDNSIDEENLPEALKILSASGLDLSLIQGSLSLINGAKSLVRNTKESIQEYKNMSPSEKYYAISTKLNSLTGGALSRIKNALSIRKNLEQLGSLQRADRHGKSVLWRDEESSYENIRESLQTLPTDYFWTAKLYNEDYSKNSSDGTSLPVNEHILVADITYNKGTLESTKMKVAYGGDIDIPLIHRSNYTVSLTLLDNGTNYTKRLLNSYVNNFIDPLNKGIPLPWELYFTLDMIFYAYDPTGYLVPFHSFNLYVVPTDYKEVYKGVSDPNTRETLNLTFSVIGWTNNTSPIIKDNNVGT